MRDHFAGFQHLICNALSLVQNPAVAREYLRYVITSATKGSPTRRYPENFSLTGFRSFTEFLGARDPLSSAERLLIQSLPKRDGVLIDVGANLGFVTLLLASEVKDVPIYAFEPNPSTYSALAQNLLLNDARNVEALPFVVSDTDGDEWFNADPVDRFRASIAATSDAYKIQLRSVTLDSFCEERSIRAVDLLKIDVEGFEGAVLDGACRMLSDHLIRFIFFESGVEQSSISGYPVDYPFQRILHHGYVIYKIGGDASVSPATIADIPRSGYTNFLASSDTYPITNV